MQPSYYWSRDQEKRLKSLWLNGYSARQIAREMASRFSGRKFTRNAVLGKTWRMGLPKRRDGHSRPSFRWTPEMKRKLEILWQSNLHWTEIRDQIDPYLTKHALKSQAVSMGIQRPKKVRKAGQNSTPSIDLSNPPPEDRKSFIQIEKGDCRYPIGDPLNLDFAYCGRKATKGSYCDVHHEICYRRNDGDA